MTLKKLIHFLFFFSFALGFLIFFLSLLGVEINTQLMTFLFEENHFYEMATCLFLAIKIGVILFNRVVKPLSMIDFWVIAISIFIFGEELSWGWQLYQFKVFDFFHLYNRSHEPNIHNIEVADGLMIEAFLYAFFTLFIIATLVVKKWNFNKFNFGFRCFLTFQCALIYGGVLYRLMINNSDHIEMLLDMPEELIEYSIAYFVLFTNFNNFNAASFSEFSVRKLNLEEKILERT